MAAHIYFFVWPKHKLNAPTAMFLESMAYGLLVNIFKVAFTFIANYRCSVFQSFVN